MRMDKLTVEEIIDLYRLEPLQDEGGYYRVNYVSSDGVMVLRNSGASPMQRKASTAIYYLITRESFSTIHRLRFDEIFHFYAGSPVQQIQIDAGGNLKKYILGSDISSGQIQQLLSPCGVWQGTKITGEGEWALMGTTVAPGFDFDDFEAGERRFLQKKFPNHASIIEEYTRD